MPAKLTDKQTSALKLFNTRNWIDTNDAHAAVLLSLEKRGFIARSDDMLSRCSYRLTDYGRMEWARLKIADEKLQPESVGWNVITLSLKLPADGVQGNKGPDDSGIHGVIADSIPDNPTDEWIAENVGDPTYQDIVAFMNAEAHAARIEAGIVEPDHSDDDTQPLEPLKTTFNLYMPAPYTDDGQSFRYEQRQRTREQYKLAYCWERCFVFRGYSDFPDIADVPTDIAIAAHQSFVARPDPFPEVVMPFIVRTWYKRLLDAQKRLSTIPLDDNAGFNDAVIDFKLIKARYMSIAERFNHA